MQLTLSRIPEPKVAQIDVLGPPAVPSREIVPASREQASPRDVVEEWGIQSFPASDPPSNW